MLLYVISILVWGYGHSAPIGSFSEYRHNKIIKPFLGTFNVEFPNGADSLGTISIINEKLVVHIVDKRMALNAGEIPLELLEGGTSTRTDYYNYMGGAVLISSHVRVMRDELLYTETVESSRARHVQTLRLGYANGVLGYHKVNQFYKRRFIFWGGWVLDNTSFNAKYNSARKDLVMTKRSAHPIPLAELWKIAKSLPEIIAQITQPMSPAELRRAMETNDESLNRITSDEFQRQQRANRRGQIMNFPTKFNCERFFKNM